MHYMSTTVYVFLIYAFVAVEKVKVKSWWKWKLIAIICSAVFLAEQLIKKENAENWKWTSIYLFA